MAGLTVQLFGRFLVCRDGQPVAGLDAIKTQELLAYLLLRREQAHAREALADRLWADADPVQARKYLRQAVWRLQRALGDSAGDDAAHRQAAEPILSVEVDWVHINPAAEFGFDVAAFERAYAPIIGHGRAAPGPDQIRALDAAVCLYRGDLLEGWYQDWCLVERERLQNVYFGMLDRLMIACEASEQFEDGLAYGALLLRREPAHERTHRRMMRLHALAGDRTSALRQYARCVQTLAADLGVEPSRRTRVLMEQIRSDLLEHRGEGVGGPTDSAELTVPHRDTPEPVSTIASVLNRLSTIQNDLTVVRRQIERGDGSTTDGL